MTFLFARSRIQALGLTAATGLGLAVVLGWLAYDEARKTLPDKDKEQDALEKLFGAGQELPQEQFFDELQIALIETIRERGWSRGLQTKKGQVRTPLVLWLASLPLTPTTRAHADDIARVAGRERAAAAFGTEREDARHERDLPP